MTCVDIIKNVNIVIVNIEFIDVADFDKKIQEINAKNHFNLEKKDFFVNNGQREPENITKILPISVYEDNVSTILQYFNDDKKIQIKNDLMSNNDFKRITDIANKLIDKKPSEFKAIGFNFALVKEFDSLDSFPLLKFLSNKVNNRLSTNLDSFDFRFKISDDLCEKVFTVNKVAVNDNKEQTAYSFTSNYNFDNFNGAEEPLEIKDFVSNNIINKIEDYYKDFEKQVNNLIFKED